MSQAAMRERGDHPASKKSRGADRQKDISRYDQDLRAAKNANRRVRFNLATETSFAPDCVIDAFICEVDKFDIKVDHGNGPHVWIKKGMIVGTEVL